MEILDPRELKVELELLAQLVWQEDQDLVDPLELVEHLVILDLSDHLALLVAQDLRALQDLAVMLDLLVRQDHLVFQAP